MGNNPFMFETTNQIVIGLIGTNLVNYLAPPVYDGFQPNLGLSENRVYSQTNSHLIGIMISKTIGFRGTLFSDTPIELDDGKIYRKDLYLMVKTMVSCRFSLKPIHSFCMFTSG